MGTTEIDEVDVQTAPQELLSGPRVALLTPYNGGNLGNAAIQDSMISNLRTRVPGIQFLGITLNCDNFIKHHGVEGFPLLAVSMPLEGSLERASWQKVSREEDLSCRPADLGPPPRNQRFVQRVIRSIPGLVSLVKAIRNGIFVIRREFVHSVKGYRILRTQDLLLFSGGGQLDEEYGGSAAAAFRLFQMGLAGEAWQECLAQWRALAREVSDYLLRADLFRLLCGCAATVPFERQGAGGSRLEFGQERIAMLSCLTSAFQFAKLGASTGRGIDSTVGSRAFRCSS